MNLRILAVLASFAALIAGCSQPQTEGFKADILAADKAFSALSLKEGPKAAFLAYVVTDTKILSEDTRLGPAAVESMFLQMPKTATLSWEPAAVEAASSGDFGYTWGRYTLTLPNVVAGKPPAIMHGSYVTLWKRQPSGAWKVVVEGGSPDARK